MTKNAQLARQADELVRAYKRAFRLEFEFLDALKGTVLEGRWNPFEDAVHEEGTDYAIRWLTRLTELNGDAEAMWRELDASLPAEEASTAG